MSAGCQLYRSVVLDETPQCAPRKTRNLGTEGRVNNLSSREAEALGLSSRPAETGVVAW